MARKARSWGSEGSPPGIARARVRYVEDFFSFSGRRIRRVGLVLRRAFDANPMPPFRSHFHPDRDVGLIAYRHAPLR